MTKTIPGLRKPEPIIVAKGDELFRPREAVEYMQGAMTEGTLAKRRCEGRPPEFLKIGRYIFYRRSIIDGFMNSCIRRSTSDSGPRAA